MEWDTPGGGSGAELPDIGKQNFTTDQHDTDLRIGQGRRCLCHKTAGHRKKQDAGKKGRADEAGNASRPFKVLLI